MSSIDSLPKLPELNKKILYTLLILIIYRFGVFVPIPGVDSQEILRVFTSQGKSFFDIINLFSGGAFERASIFALGVMPYITSSIVMSLIVKTVPSLEQMQKDPAGKKKITQYSRYLTIVICFFQECRIRVICTHTRLDTERVAQPRRLELERYLPLAMMLTLVPMVLMGEF